MGFLNHATNNIIIDAVLTERGRELLANESFDVTSFAFGDDEVDYSILTKYGISIGKEKIQKKIQEELKQTGKRLLPPQVAGPIWKEDKRIQVLYNLAVQWVNAWNSLDDLTFEIENVGDLN